ncbi:MAG: carboxymuconolactone decarboxylase family protein, partial [Dehalococcoidia bacterium]
MKGVQLGETRIPAKYKMLIGVAVAAALRSPHCSYFGTEAAKLRGATDDEIREAVLVPQPGEPGQHLAKRLSV